MKNNLKKFYFHPDFYYETANDFCLHTGFNKNDIANLTGHHPKTAQKWIDSDKPPRWLLPFLYAVNGGVISCDSFYGWNLNNGLVNCPGNRYGLTGSQIETYHWHLDRLLQAHTLNLKLKENQERQANLQPVILNFKK